MAEMTRSQVRLIEADVDAALVEIAKKHGLSSLKTTGGSFSKENFVLKVTGVVVGGLDESEARYEREAAFLKLPPLGTVFDYVRNKYRIVGLTGSGNVLAKRVGTDRTYRLKPSMVRPVDIQVKSFVEAQRELTPAERKRQDDADAKAEMKWERKVS